MNLLVETHPLEAAQRLGSLIHAYAPQAEAERRLAAPVVDALAEAGLLRLYVPRSLGGLEVDPVGCARIIEEVAGSDSAAGWLLMVANAVAWWCARLPDEGAEEIYSGHPNTIIAAAFHPPMRATEVAGGFRVTGQSPLASNIHVASWLFVTALVMEGDQPRMANGAPEVIGAILRTQECEIIDTWYALGMRGTDSNDVAASDVFVPASRTFRLVPEFDPGSHYQGLLYRTPAMAAAVAPWAAVGLAIARGAIEELRVLAQRNAPFSSATALRDRATAQSKLGQAEAMLRSARLLLYDTLNAAWERTQAGEPSSIEQKADLLMAAAHSVNSAAKVVELMYSVAGTSAIYTRSRLERHFRDAQVLKQHGFLSESRYETVGQVYLGLPPDLGLVVF